MGVTMEKSGTEATVTLQSDVRAGSDDREEGEIVDDFEFIISSDEEITMRERIKELERTNEELEQIARISESYADKYNLTTRSTTAIPKLEASTEPVNERDDRRASYMLTDASSISSVEFVTPKKRKRRKTKLETKTNQLQEKEKWVPSREHYRRHQHNQRHQQENKQYHNKHSQRYDSKKRRRRNCGHTSNEKRSIRNELDLESISLDSYDSSDGYDDRNSRELNGKEEGFMYLNRAELRFALSRNSHKTASGVGGSLKERLQNEARYKIQSADERGQRLQRSEEEVLGVSKEPVAAQYIVANKEEEKVEKNIDKGSITDVLVDNVKEGEASNDSSISLEEQELRLIALKSAVLNKHAERQKRHAEQAYSPTDFEDMLAGCMANADSNMDVVDVDELDVEDDDTQAGMEISPVASPRLLLSPEVDGDCYVVNMEAIVDTKPIDMDIANSESESDIIQSEKWMPIEQIPLPMAGAMMYDSMDYAQPTSAPINFGIYMSEVQFEQPRPPPPPPGVTDYEELPPPPPPFSHDVPSESDEESQSNSDEQSDCSMECTCGGDETKKSSSPVNFKNYNDTFELQPTNSLVKKSSTSGLTPCGSQENSLDCRLQSLEQFAEETIAPDNSDDDEEEAEALRALLLSKFQSSKTAKTDSNQIKRSVSPPPKEIFASVVASEESEDPESLRSQLLTKMLTQRTSKKPTESILKEAVHRLKMKSNSENSMDENVVRNLSRFRQKSNDTSTTHFNQNIFKEGIVFVGGLVKVKVPLKDNNATNERQGTIGRVGEVFDHDARTLSADETEDNQMNADSILDISIDKALRAKIQIKAENDQAAENYYKSNNIKFMVKVEENALETNKNLDILDNELSESNFINNAQDVIKIKSTNTSLKKQNQNSSIASPSNTTTELKVTKDIHRKSPVNVSQKYPISLAPQPKEISKAKVVHTSLAIPHKKSSVFGLATKPHTKTALNSLSNLNLHLLPGDLHLRPTRIIKPNKIINTNPELKRKSLEHAKQQNSKNLKPNNTTSSVSISSSTVSFGSRLITSADVPTVKKLIITLRTSDTETSEDEVKHYHTKLITTDAVSQFETPEPLTCTIHNNYFDNASPISLPMESPNDSPARANSPIAEFGNPPAAKSIVNDFFEKQLDSFLRDVRSKVQKSSLVTTKKIPSNTEQLTRTPVSVRHLPEAAQQEYRSLVNRMKILEKQKRAKKSENDLVAIKKTTEQKKKLTLSTANCITETKHLLPTSSTQTPPEAVVSTASASASPSLSAATIKRNLVKEVLIKNATNSRTSVTIREPPSKANVLREYESSFLKLGSGIISNLNKSLKLVEEAKTVKIAKLQHEKRMKELRAELDEVQRKFKQEQQRFSKILPEISNGVEVLTTQKQRRANLFKSVTNLGRNIKGEDYRLNNELNHEISLKSKKLASQIKLVNSIKYCDIDKFAQYNAANTTITNDFVKDKEEAEGENSKIIKPQDTHEEKNMHEESPETTQCAAKSTKSTKTENLNLNEPKDITVAKTTRTEKNRRNIPQKDAVNAKMVLPKLQPEQKSAATEVNEEVRVQAAKEKLQAERELRESLSKEETLKIEDPTKVLSEYVSPLTNLRNNDSSHFDPNGVVCPYELMGQCEDNDCSYMHLYFTEKSCKPRPYSFVDLV